MGAFLQGQLERARQGAVAPISGFRVGAAGLGASGRAYLGANLETPSAPLFETVHAEESVLQLAVAESDQLTDLAVTAPPCGHCRQLLYDHAPQLRLHPDLDLATLFPFAPPGPPPGGTSEPGLRVGPIARAIALAFLRGDDEPPPRLASPWRLDGWDRQVAFEWAPRSTLVTPDGEGPVTRFLPRPFGPEDVGISGCLFDRVRWAGEVPPGSDALVQAALEAATQSWTPITQSPSGVALQTSRAIVTGTFIESVAFNPSVTPLAAAWLSAREGGVDLSTVERIVAVERREASVAHGTWTAALAGRRWPKAGVEVHHVRLEAARPCAGPHDEDPSN